jgi:hypothetical protein
MSGAIADALGGAIALTSVWSSAQVAGRVTPTTLVDVGETSR